jgi:glycosyltransferase involved in cell wall biosynthesis
MKILITGDYQSNYNRNLILIKGLKEIGMDVIELPFKSKREFFEKKIKTKAKNVDVIFLPSFTHSNVHFIKFHFPDKFLVFDPLISKYLTKVFDYKNVSRYSPRALKNYLKDKIAFEKADLILADTDAHKYFYHQKFKIPLDKIATLPIGAPTQDFFPQSKTTTSTQIKIGFYGSFAPLQGIDKIIETAKLLREHLNIKFHIIGSGYDFDKVQKIVETYQLKNIVFEGWQDYSNLNARINEYDICLGIFGETKKADLVIPNKIFHYMACQKPVISKDTPAIRELFDNGKEILLCAPEAESIKEAILSLIENKAMFENIASSAYRKIQDGLTEKHIARKFADIVENAGSFKKNAWVNALDLFYYIPNLSFNID